MKKKKENTDPPTNTEEKERKQNKTKTNVIRSFTTYQITTTHYEIRRNETGCSSEEEDVKRDPSYLLIIK